jgi:hypothetical protein
MSSLIRDDVLPVGVGYLLVMGALGLGLWLLRRHGDAVAAGSRDPDQDRGREAGTGGGPAEPRPGWGRLIRHYAGTAIGGYLLLMAVVILYYYGVARVGGAFIESAFTGCALLIALTTPVYALASWLAERRRRPGRRAGDRAGRQHGGRSTDPPAPRATP